MNEWLNAYYPHILAIAAGFAARWGALKFMANATAPSAARGGDGGRGGAVPGGGMPGGPGGGRGKKRKWTKERVIKFITLAFVGFAGCLLAYGLFPLAQWVINWGSTVGGIASTVFGVGTLIAGWHSMYGVLALGHDMTDGTPDDEAFNAIFMIPTTTPLGLVALAELFTNPRGVTTGLAVIAVSIVSAIYAHKILKKAHSAEGHYRMWMYIATAVSAFVGVVHIPALAYLNQLAGGYLPEWLAWTLRGVLVIAAGIFLMVGLGDWIRDWTPEKWSQWGAMYTIPVFTVLIASVATLGSNAATALGWVFGAIS